MFRKKQKIGFTLAEVLITLGIIGVVAALTIPTLVNNYQKQEYLTGLKKAYTEWNQALVKIASDMGCAGDLACTGLFASSGTSSTSLGDALVGYFNVVKNCGIAADQGCWATSTNAYIDGSSATNYTYDSLTTDYKFVTSDGMSFTVVNLSNDCDTPTYSSGQTGNMTQTCAVVRMDVNGQKSPNMVGRDTFVFFITNGKGTLLYPRGGADDKYQGTVRWWRDNSGALVGCYPGYKWGYFCGGRIIEEGWQMNY